MTREEAINYLEMSMAIGEDDDCRHHNEVLEFIIEVLKQESKTGHWIEQIDHEENCRTLICSNCDRPALHDEDSIWKHKFCPHCGAKMVEPQGRSGEE